MKSTDSPAVTSLAKIETTRELSKLLNIDFRHHFSYILYRKDPKSNYKTFDILKKSGGNRKITAPRAAIKNMQSGLLPLLEEIYTPPPFVHGYCVGRSIKTNAKKHVKQKYIVNIDLRDFFPNIHFKRIVGLLASKRYNISPRIATAIGQICCFDGRLPIGAPSSGILSNMICGELDALLSRHAKHYGLIYTRYADDITFSSSNRRSIKNGLGIDADELHLSFDVKNIGESVTNIIKNCGFEINTSKVSIRTSQARQIVTGIVVNRKTNVPSEFHRSLRGTINAIEKYGYDSAQAIYAEKFKRKAWSGSLKRNIIGRLSYFGFIADYDKRYTRLAQRLKAVFPSVDIFIPPSGSLVCYQLEAHFSENLGTAFHIGNGLFLTAAHIFDKASEVKLAKIKRPNIDPEYAVVEAIEIDFDLDVCLLQAKNVKPFVDRPAAKLSARTALEGDEVLAYGFPQFVEGNSCSSIRCRVTGFRFSFGAMRTEVDRPFPHGISGGPVLNDHGFVIGLVHSGAALGTESAILGTTFTPYTLFKATLKAWQFAPPE